MPCHPDNFETPPVFRSRTWMNSSSGLAAGGLPKAGDAPSGDQDGSPSPPFPPWPLVTCLRCAPVKGHDVKSAMAPLLSIR